MNQSPEPFSNIALSLVGDLVAPAALWLTAAHPLIMLTFVIGFLLVFIWLMRKIWGLLRRGISRSARTLRNTTLIP